MSAGIDTGSDADSPLVKFVNRVQANGIEAGASVFASHTIERRVFRKEVARYKQGGRTHRADATIVYCDSDVCVCRCEAHWDHPSHSGGDAQHYSWWVIGTDEMRRDGLVGVKLGDLENRRDREVDVDVWTRESVLELVSLDAWAPLFPPLSTAEIGEIDTGARLHGRVGFGQKTPQDFLDDCHESYPDRRID